MSAGEVVTPLDLSKFSPGALRVLRDIARERDRQISAEGFALSHDDRHDADEIALAAACYAMPELYRRVVVGFRALWPLGWEWWKPTPDDRRRELVKAGALLVAEVERLDRLVIAGASAVPRSADSPPSNVAAAVMLKQLTAAEELILSVFGGWLSTQVDSADQARGIADLINRFERELPDDWRELAGGGKVKS